METKQASKRQPALRWYLVTVIVIGAVVMIHAGLVLPRIVLNVPYLLLVVVTLVIGSRGTVRFFRFDSCISMSDVFIFLSLMMFDGEAAILLAGMEGFVSSLHITKKKLTMVFNSASMSLATFITVWVL